MRSIMARDTLTAMFNFLWSKAPTGAEQTEVVDIYQAAQKEHGKNYEKVASVLLKYAEDDKDWWFRE